MKFTLSNQRATPATLPSDPIAKADSESESDRDSIDRFDYPDEQHDDTPPGKRRVKIILRDAHDIEGKGMIVEMPWQASFTILFDHFKARSCKTCRVPDEMRFKTSADSVAATDTPETLDLWHGTTTEIKVWSSIEGLQCPSCQKSGYPSTGGVNKRSHKQAAPALATGSAATATETITLRVIDQTGFEMVVKMINTVGFAYLMEQYAVAAVRERAECRFLVDGERLTTKETPKNLGLENGDAVEVYFEQIGG